MLSFFQNKSITQKQKNNILIFAFVIFAAYAFLTNKFYKKSEPKPPAVLTVQQEKDFSKFHNKTFEVIYIVDGDTIDIDIPDGKYKKTRIRLLGIDTPETKNPNKPIMFFGPEASEYTRKKAFHKNVTVILDTVSKTRDKYNRLLGYIKLPDEEILNESIITQGYGYADPRFPHSKLQKYIKLQKAAINQQKGLWKEIDNPKQLPYWFPRYYDSMSDSILTHTAAN